MSAYVNIHNTNRPTERELDALLTVIDMGLTSMEDYVGDGNTTTGELNSAIAAKDKLWQALAEHKKKKS